MTSSAPLSVTCIAPVNIAVIKYWGKRDEELILPLNDSISATLSTDELRTKTTITASPDFTENVLILNGTKETFDGNPRIKRCLEELRKRAIAASGKRSKGASDDALRWNIHVESENNFPTAAGLASSASGYACFVYTLATLYGIEDTEITDIARMGSGSACRSLHSGFVQWKRGERPDGKDSVAVQLAPDSHWPEMRIVILVVNDRRKSTSSTSGMRTSVQTSELLKYRAEKCVPQQTERIIRAIGTKDFETFARITMRDSNQMHAVCLDTDPPAVYMNDVSHAIARMVHRINSLSGRLTVAYTFDAGPNACLYLLEKDVPDVLSVVGRVFPHDNTIEPVPVEGYMRGLRCDPDAPQAEWTTSEAFVSEGSNLLKFIIHTKVGEGPRRV